MKLKSIILLTILILSNLSFPVFAAGSQPDGDSIRTKIRRHEQWYIYPQAGINYIVADNTQYASWGKMLSPSFALSAGKKFSPVWGGRLQIVGAQNKGVFYPQHNSATFSFEHYGLLGVGTLSLTNLIKQKKQSVTHYSDWELSFLLGVGIIYTTFDIDASYSKIVDRNNRIHASLYTGFEITRQLSNYIDVGLEISTNWMGSKFNGQTPASGSNFFNKDGLINVMLGVRYTFKGKYTNSPSAFKAYTPAATATNYPQQTAPKEQITPEKQTTTIEKQTVVEQQSPVITTEAEEYYSVEDLLEMIEAGEQIKARKYHPVVVYFDTHKATIKPLATIQLDKVAQVLTYPGFTLVIKGFAESQELQSSRGMLPEQRVKAVRDYLIKKGSHPTKLAYQKTEDTPNEEKQPNENEYSINRKVELELLFLDE